MKNGMVVCLVLLVLTLCACSSDESVNADRLNALEAEVKILKQEARTSEKLFREELAQIRLNLEGIQGMLTVEKGRAALQDESADEAESDTQKRELDAKAKDFVSENLDRLLAITKKLLDKMERELDKQMNEDEPSLPSDSSDGDQI